MNEKKFNSALGDAQRTKCILFYIFDYNRGI
jgi:hypothetical protein